MGITLSSKPLWVDFFGFIETFAWDRGGSKAALVAVLCTAEGARCLLLACPMDRVILRFFMDFNQLSHHLILYCNRMDITQIFAGCSINPLLQAIQGRAGELSSIPDHTEHP